MNLQRLFEAQKKLDEHIIKSKDLLGKQLLNQKILSLQVELGELANELPEYFKFWSNKKNNYQKALEEYCDCLHFILSIGLELEININLVYSPEAYIFGDDITKTLTHLIGDAAMLNSGFEEIEEQEYNMYVNHFMYLGKLLGFTWEQIEEAYLAKNKVNHERQLNGY